VNKIVCGVDVSSQWLDARIGHEGCFKRFANDPGGIADLAAFCRAAGTELVAMEATGGYERPAFAGLWVEGLPCTLLNPRSVRQFAEAMGVIEKTDKLDAGMIAWFAAVKRARPTPLAAPAQAKLAALVTGLRQLTETKVGQLNQQRLVTEPVMLASFAAILATLTREIRTLEAAIAALIDSDPLWRKLDAAFRSIKGVAGRTTARLMAEMPEIGTLSGKAITKLAGLAPIARDSGKNSGKRPVRGGRANVRSILFLVADIARRYDPDLAAFHQRLCAANKPKKVIRVALAHKLLVRLNAKARDIRETIENTTTAGGKIANAT
jgi:transposase